MPHSFNSTKLWRQAKINRGFEYKNRGDQRLVRSIDGSVLYPNTDVSSSF